MSAHVAGAARKGRLEKLNVSDPLVLICHRVFESHTNL